MKRKQNWVLSKNGKSFQKLEREMNVSELSFLIFLRSRDSSKVLAYAKELLVGTKSQGEEAGKSQTKD